MIIDCAGNSQCGDFGRNLHRVLHKRTGHGNLCYRGPHLQPRVLPDEYGKRRRPGDGLRPDQRRINAPAADCGIRVDVHKRQLWNSNDRTIFGVHSDHRRPGDIQRRGRDFLGGHRYQHRGNADARRSSHGNLFRAVGDWTHGPHTKSFHRQSQLRNVHRRPESIHSSKHRQQAGSRHAGKKVLVEHTSVCLVLVCVLIRCSGDQNKI